ncbi:Alpha-amylase [Chitinispirillum alkaliphilum]|nr:Alpha-amylase [Chitinispirillum alkaliphilum]
MSNIQVPLIYNLFPRHFDTFEEWSSVLPQAKKMGFNSIFINPFHQTGFSGSLYAVKDYYKLNPLFLKEGQSPSDFTPLKKFITRCQDMGLMPIMDLVINHTAFDSVLTESKPQWYRRDEKGEIICPYAVDPADPSNVQVWGDLAMIDNHFSTDKQGLWDYWDKLVSFYQDLGILGYRCDAAYQVPASLWKFLISAAKERDKNTRFYAETLGCQVSEVEALGDVGFDYLFNSSKWWNFDAPWALEQHDIFKKFAPSIAFPESHDTPRLAAEPPGTEAVQKCRYAFASVFSEGLMMPMGFEYGAKTRMNVVEGTPEDMDKPIWDLTGWIGKINKLKTSMPVLAEEGTWRNISGYRFPYIFLEKSSLKNEKPVYFCINKNFTAETRVEDWAIPGEIKNCSAVIDMLSPELEEQPLPPAFLLEPADIIMFK